MTRLGRLVGAIGVSVCAAATVVCQTPAPGTLSGALRDRVKTDRFELVTSIRGFPLGVRDGLQTLFGGQSLDITDVNASSQDKSRLLIAAGCSADYCLVHYERRQTPSTGSGQNPAWFVALFHWTPSETRFEWGGQVNGRLATLDDVRTAVVSGAVKGPVASW